MVRAALMFSSASLIALSVKITPEDEDEIARASEIVLLMTLAAASPAAV